MSVKLSNTFLALGIAGALLSSAVAFAANDHDRDDAKVRKVIELPLIPGWYDGKAVAYLQTDASDPSVAAGQQVNLVPALANVLDSPTVSYDDIYVVTNFKQANVIPSAPSPAGPANTNPNYSPLWQVSTVTWANPAKAHTLKSEAEVLAAKQALEVSITKTHIVVNCPVIYSPQGGTLPNAKIEWEVVRR